MKKLTTLLLLLLCTYGYGQERIWENVTNAGFAATQNTDAVFIDGILYQVTCSTTVVSIHKYNPLTGSWQQVTQVGGGTSILKVSAELVNGNLYIVGEGYSTYELYKFNPVVGQLTNMYATVSVSASSSNWKFLAGDTEDKMFLAHVDNGSSVFLSRFSTGTMNWVTTDYSNYVNPGFDDVSSASLELYLSSSKVYLGVSGTQMRIADAPVATPGTMSFYNTAGSNDGRLRYAGNIATGSFYFTGNTQTAPTVNLVTALNTFQASLTTADVDISASATPLDATITPGAYSVRNEAPFSFVFSNFAPAGTSNANAPVYLMGEDHSSGITDTIGNALNTIGYQVQPYSFSANLELVRKQHLVASYKLLGQNGYTTAVLNRRPFTGAGSEITNTGLCAGHHNEIYPQYEVYDADLDEVHIVSLSSTNLVITGLSAIPYLYDDGQNPAVTKFRIYGTPTSSAPDEIIVGYTDGWSMIFDTLDAVSVTGSAPNVSFVESPLNLCSNEQLIELEGMVNVSGEGVFSINGQPLASSTVNGTEQSQITPSGTLNYDVNIDGCFVEAGVVFSFVQPGSVTNMLVTPSSCGSDDGTADVQYTNGTSSNVAFEWSTGETASAISGLAPGDYYYSVADEYGCHVTGLASILANEFTVTGSASPVSCYGENDGSVNISVSGASDYSVLWSTGHSTDNISGLSPGNYEVTVNAGSCSVTKSYTVGTPSAITASFTTVEPNCSANDGAIIGTYSGGTGAYIYEWVGEAQTTANFVNADYGLYQLIVTDANSCEATFEIQLNEKFAAIINDSVINADCNQLSGAIIVSLSPSAGGNSNFTFGWSDNNEQLNNYNLAAGEYTIEASVSSPDFLSTCFSARTMQVGTKAPLRQEICIVTVDEATTTNLVVWEDVQSGMDHYRIYRENAVAGSYMLIDTVSGESESVFNDVVASPADRSWRYKISAVNECGIEGPVSAAHKTVHLSSILDSGDGSIDVLWDDYEGLAGEEYIVWRFTDQNSWEQLLPSVAFGTSVYTDVPPTGSTGIDYYVEMIPPFMCTAEKAQDFNSSRSNKDKATFAPGEGTGDSNNGIAEFGVGNVGIFPNPANDLLFANLTGVTEASYIIHAANGQLLSEGSLTEGVNAINVSNAEAGMYFITFSNDAETHTLRFVIR